MLSLHDVLVSAGGLSKSVDFCESLDSTSGCSLPDLLAWLLKPVLGKPELLLSGPLFTGVTVLGDPLGVTGCSAPFPLPFAGSDFTMADQEDFIAAEVFARVSACCHRQDDTASFTVSQISRGKKNNETIAKRLII